VTADQTSRIKAGSWPVRWRRRWATRRRSADFAQAGGSKPEALDAALESVQEFVRARLSA